MGDIHFDTDVPEFRRRPERRRFDLIDLLMRKNIAADEFTAQAILIGIVALFLIAAVVVWQRGGSHPPSASGKVQKEAQAVFDRMKHNPAAP